ncbi:jg23843, partial [Pararge aegeria aegeria]
YATALRISPFLGSAASLRSGGLAALELVHRGTTHYATRARSCREIK